MRADRPKSPPKPLSYSPVDQPELFWPDYFEKRTPRPRDIAAAIHRLHEQKKYNHVCHAIRGAILHNQAQPWMYEVLPFAMELAGRPQEEINRALSSMIDVRAPTSEGMTFSAALLARLGRDKQALARYRQASQIDPTRPQPYQLGLKLAVRLKDADAVGWAASGILMYDWSPGYKQRHRNAESAGLDAQKMLRESGRTQQAETLQARIAEAHKRDLILRLTWAGEGDLDLKVEEPPGTVCSYDNAMTRGGGALVHDGFGPDPKNCYEEYVCAFGISGTYHARIHHSHGNIVGKRATLTIIRYQGTSEEVVRKHAIQLTEKDRIVHLSLHQGRRKKLGKESETDKLSSSRAPVRRPSVRATAMTPSARRAGRRFSQSRRELAGTQDRENAVLAGAVGFSTGITVIPEGVNMGATAVISPDRRYVRITASPAFTNITDVFTFSFMNNGGPATGGGNAGGGNAGGNP